MLVFHTAGVPPMSGRSSLAAMGWTMKTRVALAKTVTPNRAGATARAAWG